MIMAGKKAEALNAKKVTLEDKQAALDKQKAYWTQRLEDSRKLTTNILKQKILDK